MRKRGEFKISLSNIMDETILNSTTSGRNCKVTEGERGVLLMWGVLNVEEWYNCECIEFIWGLFNMQAW